MRTVTATNATELNDDLLQHDSWDILEVENDISSDVTQTDGVFVLDDQASPNTYRQFQGVGGLRILSYTGAADANGRVFDYRNLQESEIVINNLGFVGGDLLRDENSTHAIGGGARFEDFQQDARITIENGLFQNNKAAVNNDGSLLQDAGAGGLYLNAGTLHVPTGVAATLLNTTFSGNKVELGTADAASAAYGGGLVVGDFKSVLIDGQGTAVFENNSVTATDGHGVDGGALYIQGSSVESTDVTIRDIIFSGNSVQTNDNIANGGAVYFRKTIEFDHITLEDVSFLNNTANSGASDQSFGGAISTDSDINVAAINKDVLFQGNKAFHDAGSGFGQSIYSGANVNYTAAAGRKIEDYDGIYVLETVAKDGAGTLALLGTNAVHRMGDLDVLEGVFESSVYSNGTGLQSSFVADGNLGGTGTGTVNFEQNTTWQVDLGGLSRSDMAAMTQTGVEVATNGFIDTATAQAALDRGTEYALFSLSAVNMTGGTGEGRLFASRLAKADMSDIRNSALLMHRWNSVREATNHRLDLNDYYHRNSCGTSRYCETSGCCEPNRANGHCGVGRSLWANYIGRYSRLESTYYNNDIDMSSHGVQAGIDLISNRKTQLGFMFGYESQLNRLRYDRIEADDYYFGFYAMRKFDNGFDLRAFGGYGFQNYDMDRYPDIAVSRRNQSSFDGDVYEVSLELGKRLGCDRGFTFRPLVGVDYYNNRIDGADETVSGIHYDAHKLEQLYLRAGTDIQYNRSHVKFSGGLFYSIQLLDDGDNIDSTVSQAGFSSALLGSDLGNSVLSYTLGTSLALDDSESWQVYGGYNGDIFLDRDGTPLLHSGYVGLLWRY